MQNTLRTLRAVRRRNCSYDDTLAAGDASSGSNAPILKWIQASTGTLAPIHNQNAHRNPCGP